MREGGESVIEEIEVTARKRDPLVMNLIGKHLSRFDVNNQSLHNLLNVFTPAVLQIESSGKYDLPRGSNPKSSASGGFQFLKGSVEPALNRVEKYLGEQSFSKELRQHKDTSKLTPQQQELLFIGDLLEKKGSDKLMQGVMDGNKDSMLDAYYKLHHTNPDALTKKVAKREFNKVFSD